MRQKLVISLLLFAATLALYSRSLSHQFVNLDDFDYITQNGFVTGGLSFAGAAWAFTSFHASNWHPLTWLSHMVDCQLFGLNPAGHHLTSILLHAGNAVLLFFLLQRVTGYRWRSALVAALFALHPLHVESVAWVSERKDVLSSFFFLALLHVYSSHALRPAARKYLLALLLYALSLMAKAMYVTAPLLLLLLDFWPLGRLQLSSSHEEPVPAGALPRYSWQRLLLEKVPFLLLATGCAAVTVAAQRSHAIISLQSHPLPDRLVTALGAYVAYIVKMFWPAGLAAFYPIPPTPPAWQIAGSVLLLTAVTVFCVRTARRTPYLAVGWFWFLGSLVPVIGLVQVGMQAMADRYTYIPLVGLFIMIVWGCADAAGQWACKPRLVAAAAITALISLTVVSWFQISRWKDTISLFTHAAAVTTDNWFAHTFLGMALDGQGQRDEALSQLFTALRINPEFGKAHYAVGVVCARTGQREDAIAHYREAIRLDPAIAEAYNNLANALAETGRIYEANDLLRKGIGIEPDNPRLHYNLAVNMETQDRFDEALYHYREATRINPAYASAHNNLGFLCSRLGRAEEAVRHLAEAVRLKPELTAALDELKFLTSGGK